MDSIKPVFGLVTAALVSGSFWQGFADVLSKAAVPTNSEEFGKALAALALVLVPQLVQWVIGRFAPKKAVVEMQDVLNEVRQVLATHQAPILPSPVSDAV